MTFTSAAYKVFISIFHFFPTRLRSLLLVAWKKSHLPFHMFYKDLHYKGILKVNTAGASFLMISTGGTIENEIFWKGLDNSLEPETIWIWKHLMGKGIKTIIDIGANTGLYSLLSSSINKECTVIAFEPSKNTFRKLVEKTFN